MSIRKEVTLSPETKKALGSMALDEDKSLKAFIESQLVAMGKTGISYLALWGQCESLTEQLKTLNK
jgi:hypothetical protein